MRMELNKTEFQERLDEINALLKQGYRNLKGAAVNDDAHPMTQAIKSLEIIRSSALAGEWQEEWDAFLAQHTLTVNTLPEKQPGNSSPEVQGKRTERRKTSRRKPR